MTPVEADMVPSDTDGDSAESAAISENTAPHDSGEVEDRDEADIAGDYLEDLLDIADIDGDLDIEDGNGRILIRVTSSPEGNLKKLSDPSTVDALQHLTRLAVQAEGGEYSRLILDIGGSRDARQHELEQLVLTAKERIDAGAASAALPPMSSYERKLVHDLAAEQGLSSESEGEGRGRYPVLKRASALQS